MKEIQNGSYYRKCSVSSCRERSKNRWHLKIPEVKAIYRLSLDLNWFKKKIKKKDIEEREFK